LTRSLEARIAPKRPRTRSKPYNLPVPVWEDRPLQTVNGSRFATDECDAYGASGRKMRRNAGTGPGAVDVAPANDSGGALLSPRFTATHREVATLNGQALSFAAG